MRRVVQPRRQVGEQVVASPPRPVNRSDGGHIENLGVYELLRRRCRVIVASDASADPECVFQDLGCT